MTSIRVSPEVRRPRSSISLIEISTSPNITKEVIVKANAICPRVYASSYAKEAEEQTIEWLTRFRLVESLAAVKVQKTRCGLLSGLVYPRGSKELVSLGADFFAW